MACWIVHRLDHEQVGMGLEQQICCLDGMVVVCVDDVAMHKSVQSLVCALSVLTMIFESVVMLVSVEMVISSSSKGFVQDSCHCKVQLG